MLLSTNEDTDSVWETNHPSITTLFERSLLFTYLSSSVVPWDTLWSTPNPNSWTLRFTVLTSLVRKEGYRCVLGRDKTVTRLFTETFIVPRCWNRTITPRVFPTTVVITVTRREFVTVPVTRYRSRLVSSSLSCTTRTHPLPHSCRLTTSRVQYGKVGVKWGTLRVDPGPSL